MARPKLTKTYKAAIKSERALSLKLRGYKPNGRTPTAKPKSRHKALMRLSALRRKIARACPVPGMRR
jgi:hypothetical protein